MLASACNHAPLVLEPPMMSRTCCHASDAGTLLPTCTCTWQHRIGASTRAQLSQVFEVVFEQTPKLPLLTCSSLAPHTVTQQAIVALSLCEQVPFSSCCNRFAIPAVLQETPEPWCLASPCALLSKDTGPAIAELCLRFCLLGPDGPAWAADGASSNILRKRSPEWVHD